VKNFPKDAASAEQRSAPDELASATIISPMRVTAHFTKQRGRGWRSIPAFAVAGCLRHAVSWSVVVFG
jgi:hypothetical protein